MWLFLAFLSAVLLGFYDTFKKKSLAGNAVIPVLFLNTLFSSLIFLPFIVMSAWGDGGQQSAGCPVIPAGSLFHVSSGGWHEHKYILLKSVIVLSSWLLGYFGIKHLPLTIVGPINATRPVMVLVGALVVFGERLNAWQWAGVALAVASFFMLSRSGRKEGIDFEHDRWVWMVIGAAAMGAVSGLYDRYLMAPVSAGGLGLDKMMVQSWYTIYQCVMMGVMTAVLWWPSRGETTPFHWDWCIVFISLFLSAADFVYFYCLTMPDAMISIVSMVRRSSVVVSFIFGALVFREKNIKAKAIDLALVVIGMLFLYIGSK